MLPQSPRPRIADDYPAIRARMEELRRERTCSWENDEPHLSNERRPSAASGQPPQNKRRLLPAILRAMRASKA